MRKQIFAVCDLEAEYACNFMDYLNQKKNIPFEIQAFTSVESLVAYVKKNPVELLLISSEAMCREVGELDIGKIVILTEGSKPKELEKYTGVYKYQASSDVVREVMACYGAEKAILPAQLPVLKKTTEILGVYSTLGGCLQTCFALTLAQILGREKSVLYLNLEEYAGFEELMQKKFLHTLSDLLYFVKQGSTGITVKMNGMAESMGNVDFIPPVQSPEDIRGIAELSNKIAAVFYETVPKEKRNGRVQIVASTSFFIPKPFTPFQWAPQCTKEEFLDKAYQTRTAITSQLNQKSIKYNWHEADVSVLEGILARGDRKLNQAILRAYEKGCMYDAWSEYYKNDIWMETFEECGIDISFYTTRARGDDESFPWDFLDCGVTKQFLLREWHRAQEESVTPNCKMQCQGCGAARFQTGICMEKKGE